MNFLKTHTASVLAIFAIFLCEYIDKTNKKVHNKFTNEYRHTGTRLCAAARSTEKRGVNPRRRNGTVRCMFVPMGAAARSLAGAGKALRKGRAAIRRGSPSQDIRFRSPLLAFPKEQYAVHKNVCTKVWKKLWCFLLQKPAGAYAPILYFVKNDKP